MGPALPLNTKDGYPVVHLGAGRFLDSQKRPLTGTGYSDHGKQYSLLPMVSGILHGTATSYYKDTGTVAATAPYVMGHAWV